MRILVLCHTFEEKIEWPAEEATCLKKDVQVERKNMIPRSRKVTHPNQLKAAPSSKYILVSSKIYGLEKKLVNTIQETTTTKIQAVFAELCPQYYKLFHLVKIACNIALQDKV